MVSFALEKERIVDYQSHSVLGGVGGLAGILTNCRDAAAEEVQQEAKF